MAAAATSNIKPTPFQRHVLSIPEDHDVFLGGGRGGGKTFALLLLALRHVEQHRRNARVLIVRHDFPSLRDLEMEARHLFSAAYGRAVSFNGQDHQFRFGNGATVQLDQIESVAQFSKYQGKSHSLVIVDEAGNYPVPDALDMLRSTLRSKAGIPCRMVLSANPGGPGHVWLQQRHVAGRIPWQPYVEPKSGRPFVTAPSTYQDNVHLTDDYAAQLEAATTTDSALRDAWIRGNWNIAAGAFFAAVWDAERNVIPPWQSLPGKHDQRQRRMGWRFFVAVDHGSTAPCVAMLMAESPGDEHEGRYFPRGSFICFDEVSFCERDSLSRGLGLTAPQMGDRVVSVCRSWGMPPEGCLDDACFADHGSGEVSIAHEYRRAGLMLSRAGKRDRLTGWERMRRLMLDAGSPDLPGLYISELCHYWLASVPYLDRDQRRPEDLDTKSADHWADATRYGILFDRPVMFTGIRSAM